MQMKKQGLILIDLPFVKLVLIKIVLSLKNVVKKP